MARPKKQSDSPGQEPVAVSGVFHTAVKHSHLLYEAIEITVKDGMVTEVRNISRAPDLAHAAVANCQREIWHQLRSQTKEAVLGDQA
jgi:hypothetical protein